jgi:hypothetical protein
MRSGLGGVGPRTLFSDLEKNEFSRRAPPTTSTGWAPMMSVARLASQRRSGQSLSSPARHRRQDFVRSIGERRHRRDAKAFRSGECRGCRAPQAKTKSLYHSLCLNSDCGRQSDSLIQRGATLRCGRSSESRILAATHDRSLTSLGIRSAREGARWSRTIGFRMIAPLHAGIQRNQNQSRKGLPLRPEAVNCAPRRALSCR